MKRLDHYNWGFDEEATVTVPRGPDLFPLAQAVSSVLDSAARL